MSLNVDIAIVGAGAAGLAAAIFAAETRQDLKIVLLDGARTIGAKILISGGGRCNVTNERVTPSDFHGPRRTIDKILGRFDEQATAHWFHSLGVPLKQEPTGKLFPVSNKARTVLNALLRRCDDLHVQTLTQQRAKDIISMDTGFRIVHEAGHILARRVIMATGGQSLPKSGSDGQGWAIAQRLGHTVTKTFPALVPLMLDDSFFHRCLSGTSHEATLVTRVGGKIVDRRTGSLLWTHFGISGPVVLDASRFWVISMGQGQNTTISMNFLPSKTYEEVDDWLSHTSHNPGRKTVATLLSERLPNRVVSALCTYVDTVLDVQPIQQGEGGKTSMLSSTPLNELPRPRRKILGHALTALPLPVVGDRGWNYAEVTAGGIPIREIIPHTMSSRKVPGLYLIGEMLDCDGRIGGFNFQWGWTTGYIAGCSAAGHLATGPG